MTSGPDQLLLSEYGRVGILGNGILGNSIDPHKSQWKASILFENRAGNYACTVNPHHPNPRFLNSFTLRSAELTSLNALKSSPDWNPSQSKFQTLISSTKSSVAKLGWNLNEPRKPSGTCVHISNARPYILLAMNVFYLINQSYFTVHLFDVAY